MAQVPQKPSDPLPRPEIVEEFYDKADRDFIESIRPKMAAMANVQRRNEIGRQLILQHWPDELERLAKTTWITDKKSRLILLEPNYAQLRFYKDVIVRSRQEGLPIRAKILKGRQLGFSTFIQAWQFQQCNEHQHRNSMTISYDVESTQALFDKAGLIYDRLWFPRQKARSRADTIQFANPHGSAFYTRTAANTSAGRSQTVQHVHRSELPFWPDAERTVASVDQSVPHIMESSIFDESTAQGAVGFFYHSWREAAAGENEFIPFFAPWYWDPSYRLSFPSEDHKRRWAKVNLRPRDREYMKRWKLDLEQMAWRAWVIKNQCQGNERLFQQEYPAYADEAFLTSGRPVFDPETIAELTQNATQPQWVGNILLEHEAHPAWQPFGTSEGVGHA